MLQFIVHYGIHFFLPLAVSYYLFRKNWLRAYAIMMATFLIDLDHLLATPIFDPHRCSIHFHPLHTYYAIAIYVLLTCFPKTRILGVGLLIHILADVSDCLLMG